MQCTMSDPFFNIFFFAYSKDSIKQKKTVLTPKFAHMDIGYLN